MRVRRNICRAWWLLFVAALVLPTCAQEIASVHKRFTNEDVISLVRMNLAEDVIVSKIRAISEADPSSVRFDTSVEGLKALKDGNVPDPVIRVMINPTPAQATVITQATAMTIDPNLPPPEVGVYWKDQSRFVLIEGQMLANAKVGGKAGSMFSYGFRGMHWDATLKGPNSNHIIRDRRPVFYFYVPDGSSSSDYVLLKLNKKGDRREFQVGTMAGKFGGGKAGLKTDKEIPFEAEHVGIRTYKVTLQQDLSPGEFAFFMATGQQLNGTDNRSGTGGAATGRIYDFRLPE
ncbi:hypothetical protein [Occallatibacter savannae]|uniref:hypothetical protein n=1 Tax=Occallatibacter savannae TaxID=1002691 RepID=UPI0013A58FA3|nr:hypothetical protein [Occallatibacter savannae]